MQNLAITLAVARYRALVNVRTGTWVFVVSVVCAFLPLLALSSLFVPEAHTVSLANDVFRHAARASVMAFLLHAVVVLSACYSFGDSKATAPRDRRAADLLDTAPVRARDRFWGDAVGIFAAVSVVHVCTMPLLALNVALSPLPASAFLGGEAFILFAMAMFSIASSWKLRAENTRWSHTRAGRAAAIFALLLAIIIGTNTRWRAFAEAIGRFIEVPSGLAWSQILAAVDRPAALIGWIAALCAGFVMFCYTHAIRTMERQQ